MPVWSVNTPYSLRNHSRKSGPLRDIQNENIFVNLCIAGTVLSARKLSADVRAFFCQWLEHRRWRVLGAVSTSVGLLAVRQSCSGRRVKHVDCVQNPGCGFMWKPQPSFDRYFDTPKLFTNTCPLFISTPFSSPSDGMWLTYCSSMHSWGTCRLLVPHFKLPLPSICEANMVSFTPLHWFNNFIP